MNWLRLNLIITSLLLATLSNLVSAGKGSCRAERFFHDMEKSKTFSHF